MPKSSRGGKAGSNSHGPARVFNNSGNPLGGLNPASLYPPGAAPQPTPQPAQQSAPPIQQNQPSASFDAFRQMTDDQKADAILQAQKTQVPVFLAQNDLQKVLYGLKLNDKPTLVDDSVLDSMPGKDLYRTVNASNDQANRIKYTAVDVANQVIRGSVTRVSDTGGSVHGRGIYFADSYQDSALYGNRRGSINQTAIVRVKLSPSAKTISESKADSGMMREISSGTKLGKAIAKMGHNDRTAVWALAKGYDAIVASNGYHVVINRSSLVASKTINPLGYSWK